MAIRESSKYLWKQLFAERLGGVNFIDVTTIDAAGTTVTVSSDLVSTDRPIFANIMNVTNAGSSIPVGVDSVVDGTSFMLVSGVACDSATPVSYMITTSF